MNLLNQHIEALIFCSEQSISIDEISASLKLSFDWDLGDEEILRAIEEIKEKYSSEDYPFCLEEISGGYQFLSKREFHATISALIQHKSKKKLSIAQMETLSIIAYKQPITKSEVEHIRGVNCDYAMHKLLEKDMISISGKSEAPGRPVLYTTSKNFMDYFGIQNPKDLPQLKDLHMEQNEIGTSGEFSNEEEFAPVLNNDLQQTELLPADSDIYVEIESTEISADLRKNTVEINIPEETEEEMPPILENTNDIILPDRKSIFIESQMPQNNLSLEESDTEKEFRDDREQAS